MDFMERALSENSGARAIAGLRIHARSDPGVIYPPTGTSFERWEETCEALQRRRPEHRIEPGTPEP